MIYWTGGSTPKKRAMLKKILSRLLFCQCDDVGNVGLHIGVGVVNAGIPLVLFLIFGSAGAILGASLALVFGIGFVAYEVTEGRVIKDKIFPDIQGWLWGIGLSVGLAGIVYLALHC